MSIDLAKAFNRVDHQHCLNSLKQRGASNQTLLLTAAFLEERKMRIKLPAMYSTLKRMPGGVPQGTKCRNFLFCAAVADLTIPRATDEHQEDEDQADELGLRNLADRMAFTPPSSLLSGFRLDVRAQRGSFPIPRDAVTNGKRGHNDDFK